VADRRVFVRSAAGSLLIGRDVVLDFSFARGSERLVIARADQVIQ